MKWHDDNNFPVSWRNDVVEPERLRYSSDRLNNLPAALIVALLVVAILVPAPFSSVPIPPPPELSLPAANLSGPVDATTGGPAAATPPGTPASSTPAPATPETRATLPPLAPATASGTPPATNANQVTTPATTAPPVSTSANELGRVPVLMYHAFVTDPALTDPWTFTLHSFREQLDWLRQHDFVMVGAQSLIDGHFELPAGKRPVVLTFDDASPSQFGLHQTSGGGYAVNPDTAAGVLEAYRQEYPAFAGSALFAVLPFNCFASPDDPSTCEERLNWLVDHGYEIGNHTSTHNDLTDVSSDFFVKTIGEMVTWIDERVPRGPGNLARVLVLPYGAYPDLDLHSDQRAWLTDGFTYQGKPVELDLVMEVSGGPAISPYSARFTTFDVYRINMRPEYWPWYRDRMADGTVPVFVSDGRPEVVTVPAALEDQVDTAKLDRLGLELRVYDSDS